MPVKLTRGQRRAWVKAQNRERASAYQRRLAAHRRQQSLASHVRYPHAVTEKVIGCDELPRFGTHQQRLYVLKRDNYQCRYCGVTVTMENANLDHVVPFKYDGPTLVRNLVACCQPCNNAKGNQTWRPRPFPP